MYNLSLNSFRYSFRHVFRPTESADRCKYQLFNVDPSYPGNNSLVIKLN